MDDNFMDSLDYLAIPNIIVISGYEMLKKYIETGFLWLYYLFTYFYDLG